MDGSCNFVVVWRSSDSVRLQRAQQTGMNVGTVQTELQTKRESKSAAEPGKILIVRLGSLGDIFHTLPAQQQIHRRFPKTEIHWLVEPHYLPLLRNIPGIARLWVADTKQWRRRPSTSRAIITLVMSLRGESFDLVLDFQGLIKSAVFARLSGARRVLGFEKDQCREPDAARFYTETIRQQGGPHRHIIESNLDLARFLGCDEETDGLVPLHIPAEAMHYIDTQLGQNEVEHPILVNPGAGWKTKLWGARNYAQLALQVRRQLELPVVFTYGPGEEGLIEEVRRASAPEAIVTFPTDLLQFAALCQRARLVVAGDTGPLHLAVALGTPTVAILGPSSVWRNGSFNPEDSTVKRYLFCSDCAKRRCGDFICMNIPVAEVFESVKRRLATKPHVASVSGWSFGPNEVEAQIRS